MTISFKPATKQKSFGRMAIVGPSGSGKTFTALRFAQVLAPEGKIALIDTEHGSAQRAYGHLFGFDVAELTSYHPYTYMEAIEVASKGGYETLIIDSLSHAWAGTDGLLEQVDKISRQMKNPNKFSAWGEATPIQNQLVEAILAAPLHVIVTMRSKMEYVQEKNDKNQTVITKVGMAPIQRDGVEYEFDLICEMDTTNTLTVTKTRCSELRGVIVHEPEAEIASVFYQWLNAGVGERIVPPTTPVRLPPAPPQQTEHKTTDDTKPDWTKFYHWAFQTHMLDKAQVDKALGDINRGTATKQQVKALVEQYVAAAASAPPAKPKTTPDQPPQVEEKLPDAPPANEQTERITTLLAKYGNDAFGMDLEVADFIDQHAEGYSDMELLVALDSYTVDNTEWDADTLTAWLDSHRPAVKPTRKMGKK